MQKSLPASTLDTKMSKGPHKKTTVGIPNLFAALPGSTVANPMEKTKRHLPGGGGEIDKEKGSEVKGKENKQGAKCRPEDSDNEEEAEEEEEG
mmetsp:Transcript_58141/g.109571  ORF Transcript_58141/g.109571 Transcript_58141/m.109571 type:complete len:93 (+) Transcript_58141:1-279(+)